MNSLLLANLAPALALAGIAWSLQMVQLPLFREAEMQGCARAHRFRNTVLMTPLMAVEMIAAMALWWRSGSAAAAALLGLVMVIWAVTFAGIVPGFAKLIRGYDIISVNRLIAWNGVRAACWTARSGALLYIVAKGVRI